jgi:hypothetical protein
MDSSFSQAEPVYKTKIEIAIETLRLMWILYIIGFTKYHATIR